MNKKIMISVLVLFAISIVIATNAPTYSNHNINNSDPEPNENVEATIVFQEDGDFDYLVFSYLNGSDWVNATTNITYDWGTYKESNIYYEDFETAPDGFNPNYFSLEGSSDYAEKNTVNYTTGSSGMTFKPTTDFLSVYNTESYAGRLSDSGTCFMIDVRMTDYADKSSFANIITTRNATTYGGGGESIGIGAYSVLNTDKFLFSHNFGFLSC